MYRFFQCFCCVFGVCIVLKPLCFKNQGLFFVVFFGFIVFIFGKFFYSLTKALAEVEVDQRVHGGMVDTED